MRDYWLSKLFFDLQSSPVLGDQYRANRKKILDRYPLKPEVLIEIAPDHWVNFFINTLPSICVGMGEEPEGPAEPWMKDCPFKKIAGHPKLANHILQTALERDFEPSVSHHLTLDHGFCIPLWRGGAASPPPPLPPIFYPISPPPPPAPRPPQCGGLIGAAVRTYPEDIRVAVLATGG